MSRTAFIAKVLETLIMIPLLYVIYANSSRHMILAFVLTSFCFFGVDCLTNLIVKRLESGKKNKRRYGATHYAEVLIMLSSVFCVQQKLLFFGGNMR
jgi:hypothetical protein